MKIRTAMLTLAALAIPAVAQSQLQIDTNAIVAEASGPLSEDFTGSLVLSHGGGVTDPDGRILDLLIDGTRQHTGGTMDFSYLLSLTFDSGRITGGELRIGVDDTGSENVYEAIVSEAVSGSIIEIAGQFMIGGQTEGGTFADPNGTLIGLDVSDWGNAAPALGSFAIIGLNPDGNGIDPDADVDVFVLTPTPGVLPALGMGLAFCSRRRRG